MHELPRLQTLLRLAEEVSQARTPEAMCAAALDAVERALGATRASVLLFDDDGVMRFKAWRGISTTYRAAVEGHTPWTPGQTNAEAFVIGDVEADAELAEYLPVFRAERIRALAFVPLRVDGGVIGKFMLYHEHPTAPSPDDLQLMTVVADHIGLAFSRRTTLTRLDAQRQLLDELLGHLPLGVMYCDAGRILRYINDDAVAMFALPPQATLLEQHTDVVSRLVAERMSDPDGFRRMVTEIKDLGVPRREIELVLPDRRTLLLDYRPVPLAGGVHGHLWSIQDVTIRRHLEGQLLQSHRLESLGRLAGGIAHDFNNLLTAIQGYSELARAELPETHPARRMLAESLEAARQAGGLTRQLLTFARRQPTQPVAFDFCAMLGRIQPMLRRLLREDIALEFDRCAQQCWVRADEGQLEQLVVNLVLNARDAIAAAGRIGITSELQGSDMVLTVEDDGVGMDDTAIAQAFDPFYTTKEGGRGSGLGLAAVHGIVAQCGGQVSISSHVGRGTRVEVRIPRLGVEDLAAGAGAPANRPALTHRVLLVEDDPAVCSLLCSMLEQLGHEVVAAGDGNQALALLQHHRDGFDILISDVVMPGMDGRRLASEVVRLHPGTRVVLMSGHAPPDSGQAPEHWFLPKPFGVDMLARVLHEVRAGSGATTR